MYNGSQTIFICSTKASCFIRRRFNNNKNIRSWILFASLFRAWPLCSPFAGGGAIDALPSDGRKGAVIRGNTREDKAIFTEAPQCDNVQKQKSDNGIMDVASACSYMKRAKALPCTFAFHWPCRRLVCIVPAAAGSSDVQVPEASALRRSATCARPSHFHAGCSSGAHLGRPHLTIFERGPGPAAGPTPSSAVPGGADACTCPPVDCGAFPFLAPLAAAA